jgi:hypothetical protein
MAKWKTSDCILLGRHKTLGEIKQLSSQWCDVIKAYSRVYSEKSDLFHDALYWHSERANVGALSVAAWQAGFVALEESGLKKYTTPKVRRNGRLDLLIAPKQRGKNFDIAIEAKLRWLKASPKSLDRRCAGLTKRLEDARDDIESCDDGGCPFELQLGCLFVVPYFAKQPKVSDLERVWKAVKKNAGDSETPCDLIAWCFPDETRKLRATTEKGGPFYPGVMMLMTVASNTSRRKQRRNKKKP